MAEDKVQGCSNCQYLQAEIDALKARQGEIEAKLAKARKHSGNSSKPPSSDIVTPPKPERTGKDKDKKRKRGGQVGHAKHERPLFAPAEIDKVVKYRYHDCPCCGSALQDCDQPAKIQQHIEIKEVPVTVSEHRRIAQYCPHCDKIRYRSFPQHLVKAGLVGPRLTALVGFFKGPCHMSFSAIRKFFRDVMGVPISRGHLAKLVAKVSDSLDDPYEELLKLLPAEGLLNVDETGHKDSGDRLWTWCFRASLYTLFKISPSRGSDVLVEVLGKEFDGILGCDYFSAYRKYMKDFNVLLQFCLAHFIRDVKFLAEHPKANNRAYGELLLGHLRQLFGIIHRRDQYATERGFRCALGRVRDALIGEAILASPGTREAVRRITWPIVLSSITRVIFASLPTRRGTDQQSGRASDSLCGHTSPTDPRDTGPDRTNLVRAHLDGGGQLCSTRPIHFCVLTRSGDGALPRQTCTIAVAEHFLTKTHHPASVTHASPTILSPIVRAAAVSFASCGVHVISSEP